MEYLHENQHSPSNIANYLAAIIANLILYCLPTVMFTDERIQLYIKSLKINRQLKPVQPTIITEDMLKEIVQITSLLPHPEVFISLYTFSFFSFLRISNILPHSVATFDVSRHLCIGDVFFSEMGATVLIKWSKTLQDRTETRTIAIPALGPSVICLITAMKAMLRHRSIHSNDPLFATLNAGRTTTWTDSVARKHILHFTCLERGALPGRFSMECHYRISWCMAPGHPTLYGNISNRSLPLIPLFLLLFASFYIPSLALGAFLSLKSST